MRAIVTGAAGGIGAEVLRKFQAQGALVMGVDVKPIGEWEALGEGDRQIHLQTDLASPGGCEQVAAEAKHRLGGIDVVVNNAAIVEVREIGALTRSSIMRSLEINVVAPLLLVAACLDDLKSSGRGRVVNVGSVNSRFATRAGSAIYTASKHAVAGMTKAMASELASFGITANYVMPGPVATPMTRDFGDDWADGYRKKIPAGRLISTADVASAIVYLASEEAAMINGHGLAVDGGMMARL